MKIYIAQVLVEDTDLNSCSSEAFTNYEQARAYAKKEIESYAEEYSGGFTQDGENHFAMDAGDVYVTIEIVEKKLDGAVKASVPEMVDLGLPSGLKWAKWNVGASKETDYGLYFKYGEAEGHTSSESGHFYPPNHREEFADAATAAYGAGYRMPTIEECQELISGTDLAVETINGVKGMKFTNKSDSSKYIFIPFAGDCGGGSFGYAGSNGYLWSRTLSSADFACSLYCNSGGGAYIYEYHRYHGFSVRAVSE